MNRQQTFGTRSPTMERDCLARSVRDTLAQEPALEAVTFDHQSKKISVATLGPADVPNITRRVSQTIQDSQTAKGATCGLLTGQSDCRSCAAPLTGNDWKGLTIRNEGRTTTIARITCPTAPRFWRWRDIPWPKVVPRDVEFDEGDHDPDEWKAQMAAAVVCGVCGIAGVFAPDSLKIYAWCAAYLTGSWFTFGEVLERLQKREIDVHFLMLAVAAGSACIGAWGEGATLLFLFSFSGALEHYALGRTSKEIQSLFKDAPKSATVLDSSGAEVETPLEQLRPGMRLLVRPGSQFPVDAEVVRGSSAADESNLTGESAAVEKGVGDTVLAGTMNLWGAVETVVVRPAQESALNKIIKLIKEAQAQKAPAQLFTDKFSSYYSYAILGLSAVMFFVWWQVLHQPAFKGTPQAQSAFYHAMTLLVVASPCALVLSIPSAVLAAIAWGARHGILFRGGAAVEKLAGVNVVALDKTGTLTTGELKVERVESFPPGNESEIAQIAYSLEKLSTHPLARAIAKHGKRNSLETVEFQNFESVTGQGLRARRNNLDCILGRREWVAAGGFDDRIGQIPQTEPGLAEIWVAEGTLLGRIILRDDIRPQAKETLDELHAAGMSTVVLTGDRKSAGEFLRTELQLEDVRAELKPEEKLEAIRAFSKAGKVVAMVGDGVNDAPSLAAADVGVAMGARGSDAALEQAEVVLMHDRLENFLEAFRLSQRARRVIRQNLAISLGTVIVLVCFAMLGKIPLTLGVVGHEGSTVVVVMNSLRLLFGTGTHAKAQSPDNASPA